MHFQVLDGLDEFCDEADRLEERLGLFAWLHANLPANVKVVLSVTHDGPALSQLKEQLKEPSFVSIDPLVKPACARLSTARYRVAM